MTQTMTRSKVPILLKPDLEQTTAQSPGAVMPDLDQTAAQSPGSMLQISSRQQASLRENAVREREKLHTARIGSRRNGARSACSTRLRKRARKLHQTEAKPADSEVQSKVSKDGRIQQKDDASQGKMRRRPENEATFSRKTELSNK